MNDKPVFVSQVEIEKWWRISLWISGSHAVDNFHANPDRQHIFDDFVEGLIATNEEVVQLLHEH